MLVETASTKPPLFAVAAVGRLMRLPVATPAVVSSTSETAVAVPDRAVEPSPKRFTTNVPGVNTAGASRGSKLTKESDIRDRRAEREIFPERK